MIALNKVSQALVKGLIMLSLLFAGHSFAETYTFPEDVGTGLFSDCTVTDNDINCLGDITLSKNNFDKIILNQAFTLTIEGALSIPEDADINLPPNYSFDIVVEGNLSVSKEVTINANLSAAGDISFDKEATINGNLSAAGDMSFDKEAEINGNLDAEGNLDFKKDSSVVGNCTANGGNYPEYCSSTLPPRPVVEYRFDQCQWNGTTGEVLDSSNNIIHGTTVNGAQTVEAGQVARAGLFDAGASQYINIPHDPLLEMSVGNQVSVSMWIKQTASQSGSGWITLLSKSDRSYTMQLRDGETPRFTIHDEGFNGVDAENPIPLDQWVHLLGTYDGDTVKLYVDGELQGENNGVGQMKNASGYDLAIAENLESRNRYFNGLIDEVKVYDRALGEPNIATLYDNESGGLNWDGSAVRVTCTVNSCANSSVINGLPKMEVSSFTVINTFSLPERTSVNFTQNFENAPLVFTLPTTEGGHTAAHRISNVTASGFKIITAEPESEDGQHIAMGLNFLAIESGIYRLPDGQRLEACSIETTKAQQSIGTDEWETISFFSNFTETPAVLGQIQTMANEIGDVPQNPSIPWLTTAISDVTADETHLALERSETKSGSIDLPETIAYLAAEPTTGRQSFTTSTQDIEYEIIRTGPTINGWGSCSTVQYSAPWTEEGNRIRAIPLASMNTRLGEDDGGWLRRCPENLTNESRRVRLVVDEIRRGSYNYDNNRSRSQPERAGIFVFSDNFVTEAVRLDHLRFTHPASGIICAPSTIQLSACEDSNCSTLYTGNVTANLIPAGANSRWSGSGARVVANQVEFSGGVVELELRHTQPGQITLNTSSTPLPANPLVCVSGGSVSNCQMEFTEAGFIVTVPDLIANRPDGPVTLRAVRSESNDPMTCTPAFSGDRNIRFWSDFVNPNTGTKSVNLDGTTVNTASPGTLLSLSFDANAEASIPSIRYADAGQVRLNARYEGSGDDAGLVLEGSDLFVSQPAGFVLTPENSCPQANADCTNTWQAGSGFELLIEAKAWDSDSDTDLSDNLATPNYQQSTIVLSHRLIEPAGVPGDLKVSQYDHSIASDGAVIIEQELSEVGVFEIDMTPPTYFGKDLGQHTSALTARMTPAYFTVSVTPGSLEPHCTVGTLFGYSGRALGWLLVPELDIVASNARGITTANYTLGNFNKLSASSLARTAPVADLAARNAAGDPFSMDSTLNAGTLTVTEPGMQRYQFASDDAFTFQKTIDSRVAPFEPQLAINLASLIDDDTVSASVLPVDLTPLANFELRYGRIRLENSYGPETRDLIVPMRAEYYDGTNMAVNEAESCRVYSETDATLAPAIASLVPVTDTLLAGAVKPGSELVLEAPGAGNTGSARLTMNVPLWLQDDFNGDGSLGSPKATVTFGVYRGHDRIIYWHEVEP